MEFNKVEKKSNVSGLENEVREEIATFLVVKQELSEEIEKKRGDGEDVSVLEKSLNELGKYYILLTKSLDKFDINEN